MRFDFAILAATLLSTAAAVAIDPQHAVRIDTVGQDDNDLFKRKGGGGGGGRGGGGGGGSSGGGSSGGGSSGGGSSGGSGGSSGGGSRGGSGGSGGSGGTSGGGFRGNTAGGSNAGGTSRGGSGPSRGYGGGAYYGGGAATPFRSGLPLAVGVGALALGAGALAFWPGVWYHGANIYPYNRGYTYYNATTDKTESHPVVCGCAQYASCGCGENNTTMKELVGNGTYEALNKSIINVGDYKGRKTFLVNGTLPNGTTADGPDEGSDETASTGVGMQSLVNAAGVWPAVACVIAAIFLA